jgi:hypothetical protein
MMRKTITLTVAALAASAQLVAADMPGARSTAADVSGHERHVTKLQAHNRDFAWEAAKTKGTASQEFRLEQLRIEKLINDLESGRAVDPAEIDRALKQ